MFYGGYTHILEVLEKVREEYGFEDVPKDKAMEAAWDILGKLGVSNILEDYDEEIEIEDNRGLMPDNIIKIEGIRDKESQIPLIPSKDIFISSNTLATASARTLISGYTITATDDVTAGGVNLPGELEANYAYVENIPALTNLDNGSSIGYQIRGGYIICELPEATLEIKYKGFPIWDDNTPKIPNDPTVIELVATAIAEKIAKKLYLMDKLSERKFEMIKQDRLFAQGAARNIMLTPDDNEMEFLRRMMVRLIPKVEQFNSGFKNLGERERLR